MVVVVVGVVVVVMVVVLIVAEIVAVVTVMVAVAVFFTIVAVIAFVVFHVLSRRPIVAGRAQLRKLAASGRPLASTLPTVAAETIAHPDSSESTSGHAS